MENGESLSLVIELRCASRTISLRSLWDRIPLKKRLVMDPKTFQHPCPVCNHTIPMGWIPKEPTDHGGAEFNCPSCNVGLYLTYYGGPERGHVKYGILEATR